MSASVTPTVSRPVDTLAESDDRPAMDGKFISVITSAISEKAAETARADLEIRFGLEFGIIRSDDFRSLNPGYWVVYAGPFATAEESQHACWSDLNMRTASLCYGRRLSQNAEDVEIVYPPTPVDRRSAPSVTATPGEELSAPEVYQMVAPSVAFIVNGDGTGAGSGILIEGGYVVTNHHVVEPHTAAMWVVFPDGTVFRDVPVVGWATAADLAVLGPVVSVRIPPLRLQNGEGMAPGSDVFLVGYPAEVTLYPQASITQGVLSRSYEEEATGLTVFRTDAAAVGGQSGGAMVNGLGEVIGVTARGIRPRMSDQAVFTEAYSAADDEAIVDRIIRDANSAAPVTTVRPADTETEAERPKPLEGMFVSVVVSATSGTVAEQARDDLEGRLGLRFGILRSDDFKSLNPGYWVVYAGPFATAAESQDACWSDLNMRSASLCYGRRLSQDPSDREIVYAPARS